jgi:uncharacterized membrane protein
MVKNFFKKKTALFLSLLTVVFGYPLFSRESASGLPPLQCFGTEPFWVASIYNDKAIFTLLGEESIEIKGELITPEGVSSNYAQNFVSETIIISSLGGQCHDGMSDRLYLRHGIVQFLEGKKMGLIGCCDPMDLSIEPK